MIYTKEKLEELADSINKEYFPARLTSASPLDCYDLLEALGCEVEWRYISPDDSILGATFFYDGYWYIWPDGTFHKGDMFATEFFPKGTILINQRVLDSKAKTARGSENFIVGHECAHWIKDQEYFKTHAEKDVFHVCKKNDFGSTWWNNSMSEIEIIERQTNYLDAAILMPRDVIRSEFFRISRYKNIPSQQLEFKNYMKKWIAVLSQEFGVNFNPVKYRLQDLGIISR